MNTSFSFKGFIIGKRDLEENNVLLSILTEKHGKLRVKAKGLKRITSKRIGVLETGNLVKGKIFSKGDFLVLGEVEVIFQPLAIRNNLVSCGMLLAMCELVARLLPEKEENQWVYHLFWETMLQLGKQPRVETMINFEVKLLQLLGYGLPQSTMELLRKKNWKVAQAEIWRYLNLISEGGLLGLGRILG